MSESLMINKLIIFILIVLVILAVAMFLFKPDILNWIKNLPGYEEQGDKEIDIISEKDVEAAEACPVKAGKIIKEEVYFCKDDKCKVLVKTAPMLYLYKDKEIYLEEKRLGIGWLKGDRKVAEIEGGKIKITDENFEDAEKLRNSFKYGNYLCKK